MKKIKLLNKIAQVGLDVLDREKYEIGEEIDSPDAILVRSASLHEVEFEDNLLTVYKEVSKNK